MDGLTSAVGEEEALSPRATLAAILQQCEHALTDRLAKRFSTRDSLKALEKRARALLEQPDSRLWNEEFEKIFVTASAVFDQLIAEVDVPQEDKPTPEQVGHA